MSTGRLKNIQSTNKHDKFKYMYVHFTKHNTKYLWPVGHSWLLISNSWLYDIGDYSEGPV